MPYCWRKQFTKGNYFWFRPVQGFSQRKSHSITQNHLHCLRWEEDNILTFALLPQVLYREISGFFPIGLLLTKSKWKPTFLSSSGSCSSVGCSLSTPHTSSQSRTAEIISFDFSVSVSGWPRRWAGYGRHTLLTNHSCHLSIQHI